MMNMKKKYFLLFLTLGLLTFPLHVDAGGKLPRIKPPKVTGLKDYVSALRSPTIKPEFNARTSQVLESRLINTSIRAQQAQLKLPKTLRPLISPSVASFPEINWQAIYPAKSFLTTQEQTVNYMLAKNNRLQVQEAERLEKLFQDLQAHVTQLQQAAQTTPQVEPYLPWAVEQIPAQTTMLFLGETHDVPEVRQAIRELIKELAQHAQGRKIILFTEFLPEQTHYTPANKSQVEQTKSRYKETWQSALEQNIEVVGLEPAFVFEDLFKDTSMELSQMPSGAITETPLWANLEAVRLRNEAWTRILQQYRAENPDALFVVYDGAAHSSYNTRFTLSHAFEKESPFVINVEPTYHIKTAHIMEDGERVRDVAPYRNLVEKMLGIELPQRVIQITAPELKQLAGFDIRLKIPVNRKNMFLRLLTE